jgi:hypothetical protein
MTLDQSRKQHKRRVGLDARTSLNFRDYAVLPFLRPRRYATPMMISAVVNITPVLGPGTFKIPDMA